MSLSTLSIASFSSSSFSSSSLSIRVPSDGPRAPGTIYLFQASAAMKYWRIWILRWIIALLCFTISSYLYFCKSWCLSLSITNYVVWPALFQVTRVDRRSCDSGTTGWFLVLLSRLLDPIALRIICIRHSVNVTYKLFCKTLFCTRDIYCMSVRPGRGIPPLRLFLRCLPSFFSSLKLRV